MGQMSASIAHEVNQPISAAVTNARAALRWLSADQPELDEVRHALKRIVANGDRAGEVVGRIRAFVRKAPPRRDEVDINKAILEVVALTRKEAEKAGISVLTELVDDVPLVRGDRVQLQQVVLNLIVNAIEAMSGLEQERRELVISTARAASDQMSIAIRDSGPGLAPADFERAFDAFYTTKQSGLGMGLSICRSVIEAHEGRLWAAAGEPRGAVFTFTLPAQLDRAA